MREREKERHRERESEREREREREIGIERCTAKSSFLEIIQEPTIRVCQWATSCPAFSFLYLSIYYRIVDIILFKLFNLC